MDFDKDLQKIEEEAKAKAVVELAKKPVDIVKASVSNKIANKVQTDESTIKRIDDTADKLVDSGLETVENEAEVAKGESNTAKLRTFFNEHKEELHTAGIKEPTIEDAIDEFEVFDTTPRSSRECFTLVRDIFNSVIGYINDIKDKQPQWLKSKLEEYQTTLEIEANYKIAHKLMNGGV